jgi:hypothetical protein
MIDTQVVKLLRALAYYRDLPDHGSYLPFDQADITPITHEEFYKWCNNSRQCRLCDYRATPAKPNYKCPVCGRNAFYIVDVLYGANSRNAGTWEDDS